MRIRFARLRVGVTYVIAKSQEIARLGVLKSPISCYCLSCKEGREFTKGIKRGLADIKAGRVQTWESIKKELHLGEVKDA